ncbi:MAG: phosphatidylserine/phosphatidylglycerophosphate/cardiolipin synthase family protein [Myxococcota bacterium]|nr:phosphatidylserine/phosphatidylglycerophosphate/cardiolipin synthase family protein [Myxococcota bacterium]
MPTTPTFLAPSEPRGHAPLIDNTISPTSVSYENGKLLFGKIEVSGLELDKLASATLSMTIPLNAGNYSLPGDYDIARLKVEKDTTVKIDFSIEQNATTQPTIQIAQVSFSKPFIIKNPSASMKPTATKYAWLNWILDVLKDFLANFHMNNIRLEKDGLLQVHGYAKAAHILKMDKSETITKINRTLALPINPSERVNPSNSPETPPESSIPETSASAIRISEINPSTPKANPSRSKSHLKPKLPAPTMNDVPDLLREIGAMTGRAKFRLEGCAKPMALSLKGQGLEVQGDEGPIQVTLNGDLEVKADGKINVAIIPASVPLITTSFITADGLGHMDLEFDKEHVLKGSGELAFKTRLENITGRFHPQNALEIPLDLSGEDTLRGQGRTGIRLREGDIKLNHGNFRISLDNRVAEDLRIRAGKTHYDIDTGRILITAHGDFDACAEGASIWNTTFKMTIDGEDGLISYQDYRAQIDGILKTQLRAHNISASTRTGEASLGTGKLTYLVDPRDEDHRDKLPFATFNGDLEFKIKPDGKLTIKPGKNAVADLLAPIIHLNGRQENIVDPKSPAVGSVGSPEMMRHIEKITGAKIHSNNRTELLVDGIQSFPKRLELLKRAKESICLQTFIFKDDETGGQIARQLIAAAERGVEVRVIVDTLGNVQSINDFFEEKPLYLTLKENGVKVALYNDPRKSGLSDLIDAMKEIPALQKVDGPQALKKPKMTLQILNQILRVSTGVEDVPRHVRERVTKALTNFGLSSKILSATEIREISTGALLNKTHTAILMKLVAEMNHRWHEKSMIIDGHEAILGGLNLCDEYMFGGTGRTIRSLGEEREAWRDTDIYVAGPAVQEAHGYFAQNWEYLTSESIAKPSTQPTEITENQSKVQIVSHHPRLEGDHNITNVMIENLKALKSGEIAYIENAYFLPTGALQAYKEAIIDAAKRGVDVRILTNSSTTTDLDEINAAAVFPYREILKSGARIFERTGERTLHSKMCVFGDNTTVIGSWNADNRSASLNSEIVAITYGQDLAAQLRAVIEKDMESNVAVEIKLDKLEALPWETEIRNAAISALSCFM